MGEGERGRGGGGALGSRRERYSNKGTQSKGTKQRSERGTGRGEGGGGRKEGRRAKGKKEKSMAGRPSPPFPSPPPHFPLPACLTATSARWRPERPAPTSACSRCVTRPVGGSPPPLSGIAPCSALGLVHAVQTTRTRSQFRLFAFLSDASSPSPLPRALILFPATKYPWPSITSSLLWRRGFSGALSSSFARRNTPAVYPILRRDPRRSVSRRTRRQFHKPASERFLTMRNERPEPPPPENPPVEPTPCRRPPPALQPFHVNRAVCTTRSC